LHYQIDYDLIADENVDARYNQNIVGMVLGGALTGVGTYFLAFGVYTYFIAKHDDDIDEFISEAVGVIFMFYSIPVLGVGIPVLRVNICYYNVHKNHAIKRDKYRKSRELYKQRRKSENSAAMRLMIVPSVNFENAGGGINLLVAF